jgi:hypothetical protein
LLAITEPEESKVVPNFVGKRRLQLTIQNLTRHEQQSVPQLLSPRMRFRFRFLVLETRKKGGSTRKFPRNGTRERRAREPRAAPTSWQETEEDAHARAWSMAIL